MPSSSKYYGRFIPSEEIGLVTQWKFGAMDGSTDAGPDVPELSPQSDPQAEAEQAAQLALVAQACDEAFARGQEEGRTQAAMEWQQRLDDYIQGQGREQAMRLDATLQTLNAQLQDMQQHMARDLLSLAADIAREVVRQELTVNADALQPVVREAVAQLVAEGRPATVRLNPEDMETLAQPLRESIDGAGVRWLADAAVPQGGCLVESGGMVIDGTLEKRWSRAVASLGLETPWQEAPDEQ